MFKRKKKVITKRLINSKNRYIIHLSSLKAHVNEVIGHVISSQSSFILMFDSDMANTDYSATSNAVDELLEALKKHTIDYEINKYKVHYEQNILKNILSSKKGEKAFAYKIGFATNKEHIMSFIHLLISHEMNFRLGLNILKDEKEGLKYFTSNMMTDDNRFDYYETDVFYNHHLGRLALFSSKESLSKDILKNIKEEYHV